MQAQDFQNKKITMSTVKSFIKKASELFVEVKSSFDGMTDGIAYTPLADRKLVQVSKENALGHGGVWVVGSSRDYLTFVENETHYGIEISNCCGCGTLWTKK